MSLLSYPDQPECSPTQLSSLLRAPLGPLYTSIIIFCIIIFQLFVLHSTSSLGTLQGQCPCFSQLIPLVNLCHTILSAYTSSTYPVHQINSSYVHLLNNYYRHWGHHGEQDRWGLCLHGTGQNPSTFVEPHWIPLTQFLDCAEPPMENRCIPEKCLSEILNYLTWRPRTLLDNCHTTSGKLWLDLLMWTHPFCDTISKQGLKSVLKIPLLGNISWER